MRSARLRSQIIPLAVAAAGFGALAQPGTACAAEQAARLTIGIDMQRQARTQLGAEVGRMRLSQRVDYTITLVSDGAPMAFNPLDPAEPARQLAQGQRAQQRVQAAQAQVAARAPGRAAAPTMDMQAMQAMAQRLQARCGTDRDCLMREAGQYSAGQVALQAGGDPALAARLQAYGAAYRDCERQHPAGPQRDACTNRARVQAGGVADAPEDDAVESPYLMFRALATCQPAGSVSIDERIEGSFPDVQGEVPFTQTRRVDDGSAVAALPCGSQMAVLDTRDGRLWVGHQVLGLQAPGVAVRSERGRAPQRQEGQQEQRWHEAAPWLAERLTRLNRQGSAEATLPAGTDGKTQVRLSWRWQTL